MPTATDKKIIDCLAANGIGFVTSVPCKQLSGLIELVDDARWNHARAVQQGR